MSEAPSHIRSATRGDLPEIVELLNACDVAQLGEPDTAATDVESDWDLDGFELTTDAWVAVTGDGRLVGYAYTGDQLRTGELEADFWADPDWAEEGLPARLLGLAERRARELVVERGYEAAALEVFALATDHVKTGLLRGHGFGLRRTVYRMAIDLEGGAPQLPAPAGIAIRRFRQGIDDRVMFDTMVAAFADHFRQSDEPFDAWRKRLIGHGDFDPGLWGLAWDGDDAAGALIAYDHGDLGWVRGLGVRRAWRRRGLGGALLAHAFAEFAQRGQMRVELGVDAEGERRPLRLYERAGMRVAHAYELFEKRLAD
jgi:mycothiol synthase